MGLKQLITEIGCLWEWGRIPPSKWQWNWENHEAQLFTNEQDFWDRPNMKTQAGRADRDANAQQIGVDVWVLQLVTTGYTIFLSTISIYQ